MSALPHVVFRVAYVPTYETKKPPFALRARHTAVDLILLRQRRIQQPATDGPAIHPLSFGVSSHQRCTPNSLRAANHLPLKKEWERTLEGLKLGLTISVSNSHLGLIVYFLIVNSSDYSEYLSVWVPYVILFPAPLLWGRQDRL